MRNLALNIGVGLWLTASLAFWLLGIGFAGGFVLPSIDLFTLLVLYAPWIILTCLVLRAGWLAKARVSD